MGINSEVGGPVDVLAVIDDAVAALGPNSTDDDIDVARDRLDRARAAVAELIDAGQKYIAAMQSEADTDGMLRRESARSRLRAALANVGSASHE